jgi:hypothetical protein
MDNTDSPLVAATVVETVLDIDCDFGTGPDLQLKFSETKNLYKARYPKAHITHVRETTVKNLKEGENPEVEVKPGTPSRIILRTEDEQTIVQVRMKGFSFNQIRPAIADGHLLDLVKENWDKYVSLMLPTGIKKITLRAICKIGIRLPGGNRAPEFSRILKYPPLAPDLGRQIIMTGFISRIALAEPDNDDAIAITMTNQEENDGVLPVILDVVVSHEGEVGLEWHEVDGVISRLKDLKVSVVRGILDESCSIKLLS